VKLSPLDIRHMEFERGPVGYQRRQVREFLDRVASESEALFAEVQALRQEVAAKAERIEELKATEAELKRTVIAAERIGNEIKEQARREAELVLRKAEGERIDMLRDAATDLSAARAELSRLEHAQALVREQLRGQLTAFLAALDAKPVKRSPLHDEATEDVIAALKATVAASRHEVVVPQAGPGRASSSSVETGGAGSIGGPPPGEGEEEPSPA
jgi:cell division initiation protein